MSAKLSCTNVLNRLIDSYSEGSSDARATQPGATYGAAPVAPVARQQGAERWSTSESREPIPEEPPKVIC